jgi:hypothetical protein
MVISFGLRCREDRRRLAVISARDVFDDHDGVARRDVCSRMRERRVTALPVPEKRLFQSIRPAALRRASRWNG